MHFEPCFYKRKTPAALRAPCHLCRNAVSTNGFGASLSYYYNKRFLPFLLNTPFLKYACRKFVLHEEKADSSALLQLLEYLNNINEEFEPQFAYLWFHKVQHMLGNALLIPNFVNLQLRKFPTRYPHYLAIYLKERNFLRELIFANWT